MWSYYSILGKVQCFMGTIFLWDLKIPILDEIWGIMIFMWSFYFRFESMFIPRYDDKLLVSRLSVNINSYVKDFGYMTWHDMVWHGMAQHGMAWYGMAQHDTTWHNKTWHDITWHDMIRHCIALWCDMKLHGITWPEMTLYDTT